MATIMWLEDAAKEIIAEDFDVGFAGQWQTAVERNIVKIIQKHLPFKEDVAYMPVPRCDGCKLWERRDDSTGWCGLREVHDGTAKMWPEMYEGICTTKDFGCVQWEAK